MGIVTNWYYELEDVYLGGRGRGPSGGNSLAIAPDNTLLVVGNFGGDEDDDALEDIDLNGDGVIDLEAPDHSGGFVAQYQPDGTLGFTSLISGSDYNTSISSINLDRNGNFYLSGSFSGNVDFDDDGYPDLTEGENDRSQFLAQFDAQGEYQWSTAWLSYDGWAYVTDTDIGSDGTLFALGSYRADYNYRTKEASEAAHDFDNDGRPEIIDDNRNTQTVLTLYDSDGELIEFQPITGDGSIYPAGLEINSRGHVYVIAHTYGSGDDADIDIDVDGDDDTDLSGTAGDFLIKYNTDGEVIHSDWFGSYSESGESYVEDFTLDSQDNLYVTGSFRGRVDLDDDGIDDLVPSIRIDGKDGPGRSSETFVAKLDTNGDVLWAQGFGSVDSEIYANDLVVDGQGNVYLSGSFMPSYSVMEDLDPGENLNGFELDIDVDGDGVDDLLYPFDAAEEWLEDSDDRRGPPPNTNSPFVIMFDSDGTLLESVAAGEVIEDAAIEPASVSGLTVDTDGNVYIAGHVGQYSDDDEIPRAFLSQVEFDNDAPNVQLSATNTATVGTGVPVTITFDEVVDGFDATDITVTGALMGNFTVVNDTTFTFTVAALNPGPVTIEIAAGVAEDLAGNLNEAASPFQIQFEPRPISPDTAPSTRPISLEDIPLNLETLLNPENFETLLGLGANLFSEVLNRLDFPNTANPNTENEAQLLTGQGGGNRFVGSNKRDKITGSSGKDLIRGRRGNDELNGGGGRDTIKGGAGRDKLYGENGRDRLWGGRNADILDGGNGKDILFGGSGHDVLIGGAGNDVLVGGRGNDTFQYNNVDEGTDTIRGFQDNQDLFDVTNIFDQDRFGFGRLSFKEQFDQFILIEQVGADAWVNIDADGLGGGAIFNTLAILRNTDVANISDEDFVA
ncbi:MAG: hypothetical protein F6K09_13720 [Merismopedia sp. SIO2A8]|nr:hypothetical protein [Merismopedia sp. SIO2A8]